MVLNRREASWSAVASTAFRYLTESGFSIFKNDPIWFACGMSEAIQRFETMLQRNPQNGLARFSLGKALFDANRFAEAQSHFEAALQQKPDWMVVQILLGKCQLALGARELARHSFERGLELAIAQHHEGPQAELEGLLEDLRNST